MKLFLPLALVATVLAGCASTGREGPGPSGQATGLAPEKQRITDSIIKADRERLDAHQDRLRKLNEAGVPQNHFGLAKAQCWLDTARTKYLENDRTGYVEESLAESMKIAAALEADRKAVAGTDTPLVARSARLRDDLWHRLQGHKNNAQTLECNARTVACAEVRLVRAGHAQEQTGWRQATPHIAMVEDALRRADQEAAACRVPVAVTRPAVAAAASAPLPAAAPSMPQPAPAVVPTETFVLLTDALFQFDKAKASDLLPGASVRLDQVAERLKVFKTIRQITVTGHADRLGSPDHNAKLSETRAATILEELKKRGVLAANTVARGLGETKPVTTDCSDKLARSALIQCLQPDRRVEIELSGQVR